MVETPYFRKEDEIFETTHGRLRHWHQGGVLVFVTWQLDDALPNEFRAWLANERRFVELIRAAGENDLETERRVRRAQRRVEKSLDAGHGSRLLLRPGAASIVSEPLFAFDGVRYHLDSFVIMPNHVHVLVELTDEHPLHKVVQGWKGVSSRRLSQSFPTDGAVWQESYWDRLIRDARHFRAVRNYIATNPTKAKLREGEYVYWSSNRDEEE